MPTLEFVEETHQYFVDGILIPSVTQILQEWIEIKSFGFDYLVNAFNGTLFPKERFEDAADTGTAIHKGCACLLNGGLDWDALEPSLVAPLKQFVAWVRDFKVVPVLAEKPMFSARYGFAGTPDLICFMLKGKLLVCEYKTGDYEMAGPQSAAYEMLYRENSKTRKNIERYALYLPKDGKPYRFLPLTDRRDERFFLSRLFQYQYLRSRG